MRYDHFSMLPEQAFQPRSKVFAVGGMTREGGGGGGQQPQPTSTSQTTIPEYAQPYMERLLGKSEAAAEAPYQTYGGERLTGPTAEQQAARQEVAGLRTPGQFQTGPNLAGLGGLTAMGYGGQSAMAGQNYMGLATSPGAQQAFMSPYMQNVVDVQKQEAIRDAQKQNLAGNLGAARQGTYGGARQLLAQTERERNLGTQLAQIQAAGSQKAFEAAQQAQQFGSQLGLQGLGQGIQAAGQATQAGATLGQLGIGQQQQDLARLQAQEQAGALGQREQQAALDLAYQDFLAQQRYPYSQLGFMSDILRGSGNLAGTGGTALYQAPPSTGSQLLGLASTLGGAYLAGGGKFFNEGGEVRGLGAVKNYAEGGEVIQDMINLDRLTPEQIEKTRATGARPDVSPILLNAALDEKLAEIKRLQASMNQPPQTTAVQDIENEAMQMAGLNAIPIPDDYYRDETTLASGGIIAFAGGGVPSMDPGLPYGLGYTNGMGYEGGGVVAFQDRGLVPQPNQTTNPVGLRKPTAPVVAGEFGYVNEATPEGPRFKPSGTPLDLSGLTEKQKMDALQGRISIGEADLLINGKVSPDELLQHYADRYSAEELFPEKQKKTLRDELGQVKEDKKKADAEKDAKKVEKDTAKAAKKVSKAESDYEAELRKALKGTPEDEKREAIGLALMKFGSKAMAGKSQYALQNIGDAAESGVDAYVAQLKAAKKDKMAAAKALADLDIERQKIAATRENTLAQIAGRGDTARQKMIESISEEYSKSGNPANIPGSKTYVPFEVYLQRKLGAIQSALSGRSAYNVDLANAQKGAPATAADFYKR